MGTNACSTVPVPVLVPALAPAELELRCVGLDPDPSSLSLLLREDDPRRWRCCFDEIISDNF
jgi:hypothetical protein